MSRRSSIGILERLIDEAESNRTGFSEAAAQAWEEAQPETARHYEVLARLESNRIATLTAHLSIVELRDSLEVLRDARS